jgi:hypothetical protein
LQDALLIGRVQKQNINFFARTRKKRRGLAGHDARTLSKTGSRQVFRMAACASTAAVDETPRRAHRAKRLDTQLPRARKKVKHVGLLDFKLNDGKIWPLSPGPTWGAWPAPGARRAFCPLPFP